MLFDPSWFLRIAMASVFLYHGLTKNVTGFSKAFNFPIFISALVILAETLGGLGYVVGGVLNKPYLGYTITQWASLAVIPVLIGAIYLVHWKNGFNIMNNGYEYQFVLLLIALYLFFN